MKKITIFTAVIAGLIATGCTPYYKKISLAKERGLPIAITGLYRNIDSAGGVSVSIYYSNASSKTIKYAKFMATPYNGVGDVVRSEIGRKERARLSDTGPIKPGSWAAGGTWGNVWYNSTVRCIELSRVEIDYTDGSNATVTGRNVDDLFIDEGKNTCGPRRAYLRYEESDRLTSDILSQTKKKIAEVSSKKKPKAQAKETPPRYGRTAYQAEKLAEAIGCDSTLRTISTSPDEVYQVECGNGQIKILSCDLNKCKVAY